MSEDVEKEIENLEESLEDSSNLSKKKLGVGLAVTAMAAVILAFAFGIIPLDNQSQPTEAPDKSNESNQDPGQIGLSPSDISGEIVDVNVSGVSAEPFRPEIGPDDGIRFRNNKDIQVKFTFDRGVPNFTMDSGEATIVDVNNIVYYDILPDEEGVQTAANGGSFRVIEGGVNVQS